MEDYEYHADDWAVEIVDFRDEKEMDREEYIAFLNALLLRIEEMRNEQIGIENAERDDPGFAR